MSGLLACLGFTTFDLEREGNLREAGTGVERATLDVVAYEARRRIVLAIECTLNVPKTEDYDKLLNATAYLGRVFRARSRTRLVPILVSMQESEPVQREDLYRRGVRVFNADDVRALLKIVETGDPGILLRFLEWPEASSLRSFMQR